LLARENGDVKAALLIFLFVVGTLAFKQAWDGKRSPQQQVDICRGCCRVLGYMAIVGYATP